MDGESEYQKRAKQCSERAQVMTAAVDRARWLQLAEGWAALSKMPLTRIPAAHHEGIGMWRGELSKASTDARRGQRINGPGEESRLR